MNVRDREDRHLHTANLSRGPGHRRPRLFLDDPRRDTIGSENSPAHGGLRRRCTVFIAGPMTKQLLNNGEFDKRTRSRMEVVIDCIKELGVSSFSAHIAEDWGRRHVEKQRIAKRDIEALRRSTHMVAYASNSISTGVGIEIGAAIAMGIPILLLCDGPTSSRSALLDGLVLAGAIREAPWLGRAGVLNSVRQFLTRAHAK